ncbi:hypothetical protein CJD36_016340 [Flavipsychrobacter stenotrophus]|uniref:Uncharacterized protein n=1 Tax=Flavipsychrobacter stenotrophus TaxID=2077091 RepID=A0A2S7STN7_9BACT|nr:hypothetical protein [Flavipsychrobacter stenotrophus]PQJ10253.1 hypothetical protein CJD36_016340 [Flavipsychrobacter stenotrophus]
MKIAGLIYDEVDIRAILGNSYIVENGHYFPSLENNAVRRDIFEFNYKSLCENLEKGVINEEDFLWLFSFVSILGRRSPLFIRVIPNEQRNQLGYRTDSIAVYDRFDYGSNVGQYTSATFSFIDFLINSLFIEERYERISRRLQKAKKNNGLYKKILDWSNIKSNRIMLSNMDFVSELIEEISLFGINYREKLPDNYSAVLKKYLIEGSVKAIEKMKLKYSYLDISSDFIIEHPIIKYWVSIDNQVRIDDLLDAVYLSQNGNNDGNLKKNDDAPTTPIIYKVAKRRPPLKKEARTRDRLNKTIASTIKVLSTILENHRTAKIVLSRPEMDKIRNEYNKYSERRPEIHLNMKEAYFKFQKTKNKKYLLGIIDYLNEMING